MKKNLRAEVGDPESEMGLVLVRCELLLEGRNRDSDQGWLSLGLHVGVGAPGFSTEPLGASQAHRSCSCDVGPAARFVPDLCPLCRVSSLDRGFLPDLQDRSLRAAAL